MKRGFCILVFVSCSLFLPAQEMAPLYRQAAQKFRTAAASACTAAVRNYDLAEANYYDCVASSLQSGSRLTCTEPPAPSDIACAAATSNRATRSTTLTSTSPASSSTANFDQLYSAADALGGAIAARNAGRFNRGSQSAANDRQNANQMLADAIAQEMAKANPPSSSGFQQISSSCDWQGVVAYKGGQLDRWSSPMAIHIASENKSGALLGTVGGLPIVSGHILEDGTILIIAQDAVTTYSIRAKLTPDGVMEGSFVETSSISPENSGTFHVARPSACRTH